MQLLYLNNTSHFRNTSNFNILEIVLLKAMHKMLWEEHTLGIPLVEANDMIKEITHFLTVTSGILHLQGDFHPWVTLFLQTVNCLLASFQFSSEHSKRTCKACLYYRMYLAWRSWLFILFHGALPCLAQFMVSSK